ncbi:hypothetical protein [Klebsiella variicola]|uniref:hypothetical protein n=1 Tax=Klebsiella variicola TaxID=244366 RepID=UPI000666C77C|nr:hypothetical protein [Klebsiella variicola]HBZ7661061.1 hypothetical protein [Klebsiella variicola subsp. variicola]MCF6966595.1 hypothetical protein [Klebsiella variicola]SXE93692.1 Uncharacterised protein [Klebsiella variicola]HBX9954678.1 hypothetical protein [Klebsiella variicola]HBY0381189.1 hypothetical protein [Klebsiella variicola]
MLQQQPIYEATGISQYAMFVNTQRGVAVVERSSVPLATAVLLISYCGVQKFARFLGGSLITEDGDAIEGDVLSDVELIGVVTHIISKPGFDDCPAVCWWSGNWIGLAAACAI